jgi:signal peptidase
MKILKGFIHVLANISYILILIYLIVDFPSFLGYKPLIVLSDSMKPTYKTNSVIYYKEVPKEELKVGDIITFEMDKELVSHRIYEIKGDIFITKGDANNAPDNLNITYEQIKGKDIKYMIPYIGVYISFINRNLYLVPVVVVILILEFILSNTKLFGKNKKVVENNNEKKEEKENGKEKN